MNTHLSEDFGKITPYRLEKVKWAESGFYYEGMVNNPGKHPHHYTGLYYIQEPSAMLPGESAGAAPGDRVLDLCASPGGKTVRLAAGMRNQGFLAVNDIKRSRITALVKNIEISGITNAVVFNETPDHLAEFYRQYFDIIVADVPCSGEGTLRKDPGAAVSLERYNRAGYPVIQKHILACAYNMLKPGGRIIYSTCTFAPEENEGVIADFLDEHSDCSVIAFNKKEGLQAGRPDWAGNRRPEIVGTARIWPHKARGEGHFTAILHKDSTKDAASASAELKMSDTDSSISSSHSSPCLTGKADKKILDEYRRFEERYLNLKLEGRFIVRGQELYLQRNYPQDGKADNPRFFPEGLRFNLVRPGWHLGSLTAGGFEPSKALVPALGMDKFRYVLDYHSDSAEAVRYLKGETIEKGIEGHRGFAAVCIDGFAAGFVKQQPEGYMKNMYPPGWRLQ